MRTSLHPWRGTAPQPMRGALLLSGAAHGLIALLLIAGAALWPAARPVVPPVLAEVELIVQKTPAVGPMASAGAADRKVRPAPSGTAPEPPKATVDPPPAKPASQEEQALRTASLPLPPESAPRPPLPVGAPREARSRPTPPMPTPDGNAAPREATAQSLGTGIVSGPQVIPAAVDKAVRNVPPAYPPSAVRRSEQGAVLLEVTVAPNGTASAVSVVTSSGYPILDRAAREAVAAWRFIAARRAGSAIASTMELRIRFALKDATDAAP